MLQTSLRRFIENCGVTDMAMCLYALKHDGSDAENATRESKSLFFYHMEKAGGIAVHTALTNARDLEAQESKYPPGYFRFHASDEDFDDYIQMVRNSPRQNIVAYVGKVGIRTYGVHREIGGDWRLMTLVRNPFDRLVSHYFYLIRRKARPGPASEADFLDYVGDWRCNNYHCRMLAKYSDENSDVAEVQAEAFENLAKFDFVDTVDNIETALLNVWSEYKFLPVISQRIHANPHKTNEFEHLRDDVYDMNRYDMELFERVKAKPTYPHNLIVEADDSVRIADKLALAIDNQTEERGSFPYYILHTQGFVQLLQNGAKSLADVEAAVARQA